MFSPATWRARLSCVVTDVTIGSLIAFAGFSFYQAQQERFHFSRLVHTALHLDAAHSDLVPRTEENAVLILHKVHDVVEARHAQLADVGHPEPGILWSSDEHLSEPSGACASYTQVLAKSLKTAGYPIRKVGLAKDGRKQIHHVLETEIGGRWVVLDALNDLAFHRADGHLASAEEVHADWAFFQKQTPPDYNPDYDYSEFYYTNWDSVPGVGSVVLAFPPLHKWLEDRGVSLRFLLLDVYQWFAGLSLVAVVLLLTLRLWPKFRAWRARRRMVPQERNPRRTGDQTPTLAGSSFT